MESFPPSPRGSAALQDAAALAECLQEASALDVKEEPRRTTGPGWSGWFGWWLSRQVANLSSTRGFSGPHMDLTWTSNGPQMWIDPAGSSTVTQSIPISETDRGCQQHENWERQQLLPRVAMSCRIAQLSHAWYCTCGMLQWELENSFFGSNSAINFLLTTVVVWHISAIL